MGATESTDGQPLLGSKPSENATVARLTSDSGSYGEARLWGAVRKAVCVILIASLVLSPSLAIRPVRHCWDRISKSVCHRPLTIDERVHKILSQTPLIDGHNDLAIAIRYLYNNHIYDDNFTVPFEKGGTPQHVDLPRLREGQNGGAFWSVFTPCPANGSDFSDENYSASVQMTLQQIDLVTRLRASYPDVFSGNVDSSTALAAFKKGQLISPMGVEGLHQIGNSVANLRRYHALGVRYATLTHNCHNIFADAALLGNPMRIAEPYWGGVSPLGRRLVREMNRIGMIVDLSHTSVDTMLDVLGARGWEGSLAPVIFSHSSSHALCPHPRNVPDAVLKLVRTRRGLVMVNFAGDFVSCAADPADPRGLPQFLPGGHTLAHVADHVVHIGERIGFGHVGLGSDFDGIPSGPEGLEDVSRFPALVAELLRRGVSDEDAAKVVGGNLLRVWADVDAVARELQAAREPVLEDDLPSLMFPGLGFPVSAL